MLPCMVYESKLRQDFRTESLVTQLAIRTLHFANGSGAQTNPGMGSSVIANNFPQCGFWWREMHS